MKHAALFSNDFSILGILLQLKTCCVVIRMREKLFTSTISTYLGFRKGRGQRVGRRGSQRGGQRGKPNERGTKLCCHSPMPPPHTPLSRTFETFVLTYVRFRFKKLYSGSHICCSSLVIYCTCVGIKTHSLFCDGSSI